MYILFKNNTNGTYATVPANGITELAQEASLFSGETFYLGSTVCRSFKLGIDKRFVNFVPGDAAIIYEGMPKYADLVVDNTDDEDVKAYKFTLTDRMVRLNEQDSSWFTSGKTIQQLLSAICTQYGIAGVDTIAAYGDVAITWYDNWTARDFVSWVAELLGGYAYISANNYLKFDTYSNTPVQTIPVENCDSFKLGEQITIDRVVYDLPGKTVKYPVDYSGTGCTLYLNTDNALFTDSGGLTIEDQVEYIYNVINGFSFYNITVGKCPINRDVRAGQCIGFSLDGTVYNTIAQVNWNYNSMWLGGYELKLDSPVQAETQIVGTAKKTQTIIQKIDREVGEISSTVASVQESTATITNMLYDTNAPSLTKVYASKNRYFNNGSYSTYLACSIVPITNPPRASIDNGARFSFVSTDTTNNRVRCLTWYDGAVVPMTAGTTYTMSCYARISSAITGNFAVMLRYGHGSSWSVRPYTTVYDIVSEDWVKYSWTFTADENYLDTTLGGARVNIGATMFANTTAGAVELCDFYMQTSDYTIENLQNDLSGVNSQITTINNNVSNITQTTQSIQTQVTQTQTTLQNDYATKEQLSSSVSSLSTTIEQTAQDLTIDINKVKTTTTEQGEEISQINSYFEFASDGLTIGKSDSEVRLKLENDELSFNNNSNKLAWLDSGDDGLGANALSIGNATTANQRWRVFTRQNGSHLTFTRHS
jgi:uncharacterized protein YoxC